MQKTPSASMKDFIDSLSPLKEQEWDKVMSSKEGGKMF